MTFPTAYTELVGCTAPVQQAPMGGVSSPDLAVAVANAGGVGTIVGSWVRASRLDETLAGMASATSGALSVNFLGADVDREAVSAAAERVRLIDFFWSPPDPGLIELAHAEGALVCWQVGDLDQARRAVDAGADVVAAQGIEAGGHVLGRSQLLPLLREVVGALEVPVLAAGGIGDGAALARVLEEGAAGARIGTRFLATTESAAHPDYKAAVVAARAEDTVISDAFAVCPLCAVQPTPRV